MLIFTSVLLVAAVAEPLISIFLTSDEGFAELEEAIFLRKERIGGHPTTEGRWVAETGVWEGIF